jgi:hypothetical protein
VKGCRKSMNAFIVQLIYISPRILNKSMKWSNLVVLFCLLLFLCSSLNGVSACKDIIVCGDATEGDYNLLLKIRDPSRPGYQVLTMVP